MKLEFFGQVFEKYSNIKFHENQLYGSRVVPCWRTIGRADVTKLTVAFRYSADATTNTVRGIETGPDTKKCCLQPTETAISFWQKWGEMSRNSGKAAVSCPTSGSSLGVINSNETASTHPWVPVATWCTGNVPTDTVPFKLMWQQRRFTPYQIAVLPHVLHFLSPRGAT